MHVLYLISSCFILWMSMFDQDARGRTRHGDCRRGQGGVARSGWIHSFRVILTQALGRNYAIQPSANHISTAKYCMSCWRFLGERFIHIYWILLFHLLCFHRFIQIKLVKSSSHMASLLISLFAFLFRIEPSRSPSTVWINFIVIGVW